MSTKLGFGIFMFLICVSVAHGEVPCQRDAIKVAVNDKVEQGNVDCSKSGNGALSVQQPDGSFDVTLKCKSEDGTYLEKFNVRYWDPYSCMGPVAKLVHAWDPANGRR